MAKPKTLNFQDMMNASLGRKDTKTTNSSNRLAKTDIGKGKPSQFQNPNFAIPTLDEVTPTPKKKTQSKTQQRLAKTSIGKGIPTITDSKGNKIDVSLENLSELTRPEVDALYKGPLLDGMKNTSKTKVGIIPTLTQVALSNNFAKADFATGGKPKVERTIMGSNIKIDSKPSNTRAGYQTARRASTKLQNLKTLTGAGLGLNIPSPTTPSIGTVFTTGPVKKTGNLGNVVSPYGNFANPSFGGKVSSYRPKGITGTPSSQKLSQTQSQFSQNIKLLSGGFSLSDANARAAIARSGAASSARLAKVSKARAKSTSAALRSNPNLSRANAILREIGADYQIGVYTRRRRRGRYETSYVAYYTGPSTRRSYTRTVHNGRRVTAYRGYSTGQRIYGRNTSPESVIRTYERNKAISAIGIESGIAKGAGESTASHSARVQSAASSRKSIVEQYMDPIDASQKAKLSSLKSQKASIDKQIEKIRWNVKNRIGQKSAAGRRALQSTTSLEDRSRQLQREIDELQPVVNDAYLSYVGVTDAQIGDLNKYYGELMEANKGYDTNINILQQAVGKIQSARGQTSAARRATGFVSTYDAIESREKPFADVISSTSAELSQIGNQINLNKNRISIRNDIGKSVNELMNQGIIAKKDTISVGDALTEINSKIAGAEANAKALAARPPVRRSSGNRSAMRAAERANRARRAQVEAANAVVSRLKSTKAKLEQHGTDVFGSGVINEAVIAKPSNLSIQGQGGGKRKWYRGVSGSTRFNIGKDKVPASGKVTIEATVSYTSGYKGPTHADTTLGKIQGTQTVRKEVPVDANGNIIINSTMYGVNRPHHAKMSISNVKVIDNAKSSVGSETFGNLADLTSRQQALQTKLKENQAVKNYFDNAQEFLTGKSSVLKDKQGNVAAKFNGNQLNIVNENVFKDVFGTADSDVIGATRSLMAPISQIRAQKAGASGAKLTKLQSAEDFFSGKTNVLDFGQGAVASRGQLGKIDIKEGKGGELSSLGISLSQDILKQKAVAPTTKKFTALESNLKAKEATQKALIAELKTAQKERIKENAAASAKQVDALVAARQMSRRDAVKQKSEIAKVVAAETAKINAVDESNIAIPDIEEIDTDLKSEAQRILEGTRGIITATKKNAARQKLRQVVRSRKPAVSPVGAVLKVGATVPRPRDTKRANQDINTNAGQLRNPFVAE